MDAPPGGLKVASAANGVDGEADRKSTSPAAEAVSIVESGPKATAVIEVECRGNSASSSIDLTLSKDAEPIIERGHVNEPH
eukprot:scaffold76160_cov30-Tisochrysis_lutea.AAC.12